MPPAALVSAIAILWPMDAATPSKRRRSGQGFDVADHDFGVGDAGVCGQGMAGREIRAREQQRRGRQIFDHCFLLLFDCFFG